MRQILTGWSRVGDFCRVDLAFGKGFLLSLGVGERIQRVGSMIISM